MLHNKKNIAAFLALGVLLFSAIGGLYFSAVAHASGEQWKWTAYNKITISGGDLQRSAVITFPPVGNSISSTGTGDIFANNCFYGVNVTFKNNTLGRDMVVVPSSAPTVASPSGSSYHACSESERSKLPFSGAVTTINDIPSNEETDAEKKVSVFLGSGLTNSPAKMHVTITSVTSGNKYPIVGNRTATGPSYPQYYKYNYVAVLDGLVAGNTYKACVTDAVFTKASSAAALCKQFTKVQHTPATISFEVGNAVDSLGKTISGNLTLDHPIINGASTTQPYGKYNLQLKSADGTKVFRTITVDMGDYTPSDTCRNSGACGSINSVTKGFTFSNVGAGTYQLCVEGTTVCKTITRKINTPLEDVDLTLSQEDTALASAAVDGSSEGDDPDLGLECGGSSIWAKIANPLNWLTCSVLGAMTQASKQLDNAINDMLCINEDGIFGNGAATCGGVGDKNNNSGGYKTAWNSFRLIALGLLVITGLIMVLSQTMGLEIFDAYSIRKTLPRLLVAIIGVSLSWQLMEFFVSLSNALGIGVRHLIYAPFSDLGSDGKSIIGGGTTGIGTLFALGGMAVLGALGILSFVATALLAILVAFFVLVIRNMVVILLIIMAPVAIIAYALPNTEKIWKLWWDGFSKALMMFPIITAFIAVGHVFSAISAQQDGAVTDFVAIIAYFAPYFLLPMTFRLAGGAIATIGGMANDRSRGAFDRLKNFRGNQMSKNWNDIKSSRRFKGGTENNFRGRINRGLGMAANAPAAISADGTTFRPGKWRSSVRSGVSNHAFDHAMEATEKDAAFRAIAPDDDMLSAGLHGKGTEADVRSYLEARGRKGKHLEDSVRSVMAAKRSLGDEQYRIAAAVGIAGTKTGYAGGFHEMAEALGEASGGDKQLAARMLGVARGQAGRAGRVDLAGHGFGSGVSALYTVIDSQNAGNTSAIEARIEAENTARSNGSSEADIRLAGFTASQGAGAPAVDVDLAIDTFLNNDMTTIMRGDTRSVRNIMEAVQSRITTLSSSPARTQAEDLELGQLTARLEMAAGQGSFAPAERIHRAQEALDGTVRVRAEVRDQAKDAVTIDEATGIPVSSTQRGAGYREQTQMGPRPAGMSQQDFEDIMQRENETDS